MKYSVILCSVLLAAAPLGAELKSGPPLPHKVVPNWAKLPNGWNFGECSGVAVDKQDHVWVFNRGPHPVIEFNRDGTMLHAWGDNTFNSSHGIRVDQDGNIWTIDVIDNAVM